MQRRTLATWIVLLGLIIGLLGNIFFYGKNIGLSFPLFIIMSIAVTLAASRPAQTPVNRRNLWLLVPVIFFALMVAVREDTTITFLNVAAGLSLAALALHYLSIKERLDEATLPQQIGAVLTSGMYAIFGGFPEVSDAWAWTRGRSWKGRAALSVVRGLVIALPIVIVFTVLLGSADAVFAGYVEDVWQLIAFKPSAGLFDQAVITLTIGWLAIGSLAYGLARRETSRRVVAVPRNDAYYAYGDDEPVAIDDQTPEKEKPKNITRFRLGMIESGIILGLVDLLFAAFVMIQFAYFFGGQNTIEARGLTYSSYARSGFFELVAVSVITLGLGLWLDYVTVRQEQRENRIFQALLIVIVALTSVMLVSASQRMLLYEEMFGFTHLRVFTHVSMLWLGILLGVFLLSLFRVKKHVFSFGALLVAIGYLGTLNVMNVDLYIAERNIARYHEGSALDLSFLTMLSADALPAIIPLHEELKDNPEAQTWTGQWLARQLNILEKEGQGGTIFSANLSGDSAWATLDAMRNQIPTYDPYFFYESSYYGNYYEIYSDSRYPSGWDSLTPTAVSPVP
jgi:Domain of unknown function (DUF4173)